MKRRIFLVLVCILAFAFVLSCATSSPTVPAKQISFKGADAANGATLRIGKGVTITVFDGEEVNWTYIAGLLGNEHGEVYVPEGLHSFTATSGFLLKKDFNIGFKASSRYVIETSINGNNFIFEEMR